MPPPPFGSASAYDDAFPAPPPKRVTIAAETCFNLSVFKEMVRQYRKLDDQVIIRLNRASAQLRDQDRLASTSKAASLSSSSSVPAGIEGMCARMWGEMMAGWAHRQTLLTYCLQTVTSSLEAKKPGVAGLDERLSAPQAAAVVGGRERGWREEEVLANQLANEESIEAIIRKRTLEAFRSRCPFFAPPPSDPVGREWWDLADSGRRGRGPDID